ncbi:MAG TPA: DUF4375 domain-containing protein [Puia sp.]|nr:DUF4375 domain-containing protein [Puia sp.]
MARIENLDHIVNTENRTRAVMILYDFICKYDFDELTEPQKHFYFIQELENAINMDGFYLYFWNSRGGFAAETLQSLTAIGAFHTCVIMQKAIDQFPGGHVPKEWLSRQRLVEQIGRHRKRHLECSGSGIFAIQG